MKESKETCERDRRKEDVRAVFRQNPDEPVSEVMEHFGLSRSAVYAHRAAAQKKPATVIGGVVTKKVKAANTRAVPKRQLIPESALTLTVRLPNIGGPLAIQLRDANNTLLGTLDVVVDGLIYRRPNQKTNSNRCLSWSVLDKLMQLGIV